MMEELARVLDEHPQRVEGAPPQPHLRTVAGQTGSRGIQDKRAEAEFQAAIWEQVGRCRQRRTVVSRTRFVRGIRARRASAYKSGSRPLLFLLEQLFVIAIVLAEELVDAILFRQERKCARDEPRAGEHVRIFNHRLVLQRAEVRPPESLDDMQ